MEEAVLSPGRQPDGHFPVRSRLQELWQHKEDEERKKHEEEKGTSSSVSSADVDQSVLNWAFERLPVSLFPPVPSGQVIEIPSSACVADALRLLSSHGILSAPVRNVDAPAGASWIDRYLGMMDFAGVLTWAINKSSEMKANARAADAATAAQGTRTNSSSSSDGSDLFSLLLQSEALQTTKVADVSGSFRWAPFLPVTPDDSLLTLLLLVSRYRIRSVPVVASCGPQVMNLVTQSAVVEMLGDCLGLEGIGRVADRQIRQLGLPGQKEEEVIVVEDSAPVLAPFRLMLSAGVGGVPVVAAGTRQLVGSVCVRDIQLMLMAPQLFREERPVTVSQFLEIARSQTGPSGLLSPAASPPLRCLPSITLSRLMRKMHAARARRVYVTDEVGGLQGVVTLRDIIGKFVVEPLDYFGDFFGGVVPDVHPTASEPRWRHDADWGVGVGW